LLSSDEIKTEALRLGFDACGIAEACALPDDAAYLRHWLDAGYNAEMGYMANYFEKRTDVCQLFEGAKSVIVVLLGYYPAQLQPKDAPQVAKYAYGADYHFVIKEKLRALQQFIDQRAEQRCQICVDSAPVLERRWAQRAGLGWIGKSGLLVNPTLGSYTLIGEIITTLPLTYDTPMESRCGRCTRCLEACPTGALMAEHTLDARRCISYITIEQRAELTPEQRQMCGNRIFGCDACLDACPWNQHPKPHHTEEFMPSEEFFTLDWSSLTNAQFRHIFKHSPLQRAGFKKISNFKFQISD
jgi:epoxyqueuosine reductase